MDEAEEALKEEIEKDPLSDYSMNGSGMSEDDKMTVKQMFSKSIQSDYSEDEMEEAELFLKINHPGEAEEIVHVGKIKIPKEAVDENSADYQRGGRGRRDIGSYRQNVLNQHNTYRKQHGAGQMTLNNNVRVFAIGCPAPWLALRAHITILHIFWH